MRTQLLLGSLALIATFGIGCTPARYRQAEDRVAHGPESDTGTQDPPDSSTRPHDAAVVPGEDAWVAPGHDAGVRIPDAWVAPVDAYSGSCPTYAGDVQPIYRQHCSNCHTTGGDVHFGSSYSAANGSSSSCGASMAACTIQLGRPGGSMARRDSLGGFSTAEQATIQSWIDCGRPM